MPRVKPVRFPLDRANREESVFRVKGVEDTVSRDIRLAGPRPDRIGASVMKVDEAAVFLALSRFLLSKKLVCTR